jgi:hypothetical protein
MSVLSPNDPGMSPDADTERTITFETLGVPISIEVSSAALRERVEKILPPIRRACDSVPEDHGFRLISRDGISYRVRSPGDSLAGSSDLDVALEVLDSELRTFIAVRAPQHIFVHAGVVAHSGRAIVIPGPTFTGKSSLVAEFVREGAVYYSDEFAVLDGDGLVHPYPKPLSLRVNGLSQSDFEVSEFGGISGAEPIPVGLVLVTRYVPGARWSPRELSHGEATLAVLANTIPAQDRPQESLEAVTRALAPALTLEGERGEAAEVVGAALDILHSRL